MCYSIAMTMDWREQLDTLLNRVDELEAKVDTQQKTIENQRKKIHRLESALAAAKKNSSNSSKPPSSDIVKAKKKDDPDHSDAGQKRKRGAQVGHEPNFRDELTPDQIDEVFEYTLTNCPHCGTKLEASDRVPSVVQQIKIVEKPIRVEEH